VITNEPSGAIGARVRDLREVDVARDASRRLERERDAICNHRGHRASIRELGRDRSGRWGVLDHELSVGIAGDDAQRRIQEPLIGGDIVGEQRRYGDARRAGLQQRRCRHVDAGDVAAVRVHHHAGDPARPGGRRGAGLGAPQPQ
jgi:hypothetical protein